MKPNSATPIRLGQEFRGYAGQIERSLRRLATEALVELGGRLQDPSTELHDRVVRVVDDVAPQLASAGPREVGSLIEATIERWDAEDTSRIDARFTGEMSGQLRAHLMLDSVAAGNLYVKGHGDPTLVLEKVWKMVYDLKLELLQHLELAKGREVACNVLRRQRLWECFLYEHLKIEWARL